jgi:hypothetical protein
MKFDEIEIVGPAHLVASFRMHMQDKVDYIVEENSVRIRAVLDRSELPFFADWHNKEIRQTSNGKVFIFLKEENLNGNLDQLARGLNR